MTNTHMNELFSTRAGVVIDKPGEILGLGNVIDKVRVP
jgi:hypothetical protein